MKFRKGTYEPFRLPMIPGLDFAGRVDSVGERVISLDVGDRVFGTSIGHQHLGGYAEYATVRTDQVVKLSDAVDFSVAGGAGVVAVTAWRALMDHADLKAGDTCLIHGGSGGVGHVAVQLAAYAGTQTIATTAPKYHDQVRGLGADTVLDYQRDDLQETISEVSDGGVDIILDHRTDEYLGLDAAVAADRGRIIGIGEQAETVSLASASAARQKDLTVQFMSMFNTAGSPRPTSSARNTSRHWSTYNRDR